MRTNRRTRTMPVRDDRLARVDSNTRTFGGAAAFTVSDKEALERAVLSCLLFEKQFYESGEEIAARIKRLVPLVNPSDVYNLAVSARNVHNLRHVPLLLAREMARHPRHKAFVDVLLPQIILRADELTEFMALYWSDGKTPIANSVKRGLAEAFTKFNEYELAKWNRDANIKLRDVMFLVHPNPVEKQGSSAYQFPINRRDYKRGKVQRHLYGQGAMWKRLADDNLATPETWEVLISSTTDQRSRKERWEYLLREHKLGYNALLMNLRNMTGDNVNRSLILDAIENHPGAANLLPYQFVSAANAVPEYSDAIEQAMLAQLKLKTKLPGFTIIACDVSGSMGSAMSARGQTTLMAQAALLSALVRERCQDVVVLATAGLDGLCIAKHEVVPTYRGFALGDAILRTKGALGGGGIFVKQLVDFCKSKWPEADRLILITDEQDTSSRDSEKPKDVVPYTRYSYMMNVASTDRGVGYGAKWTHINGLSTAVVDYALAAESYRQ